MTGRAALAALALAAPAAADVPGRVSASVATGGGWASDVFVGAGAGENVFAQLAPAARLDLALAPAWKLAALGEAFYGTYQPSAFTTLSGWGALEGRWLPSDSWELSLTVALERASFSRGEPLDPGFVASPTVTAATGWRLTPAARLRVAQWEFRASALAAGRSSSALGQPVDERIAAVLASASHSLGRLDLSLGGRLARYDSDRQDFAFGAAALFLGAGVRVFAASRLEALLQVQGADFDTGARENLTRLTLSATQPLSEKVDLELAWSYAGNVSSDPSRAPASRYLVFLGLTARAGSLEW